MKMLPYQGGFHTLQTISNHFDNDTIDDDYYEDDEEMLMTMMMDEGSAEDYGTNSVINNSRTSSTSKLSWKKLKHAKSEQKRRQRINSHHATLRHLFPNLLKKDKASLLGETVRRLRELNEIYRQRDKDGGGEGWLRALPSETNEATVSYCEGSKEGAKRVKMVVCCEDNPSLNRELMDTIRSVRGRAVRAEMSTVGGRTKAAVVVEWQESGGGGGGGEEDVVSLRRALRAIVDNRAFDCGRLTGRTYSSTKWAGLAQEFIDTKQASKVAVSESSEDGLAEGLILRRSA